MAQEKEGCVKPARGPLGAGGNPGAPGAVTATALADSGPAVLARARVGKEAPDFEANAYVEGKNFDTIRLSSYKGKWIVLCFYPGDFTFV